MKKTNIGMKTMTLVFSLGLALSACAQTNKTGGDSWKEEVLLHDGQKIIVERSQTYGGRHEITQAPPIREHTIRFKAPNSNVQLSWTSEYGEELGRTNFNLLALHIKQGTPYLVAEPNLCLSYNIWGRPNPPYVFFRYEGKEWKRIAPSEFPVEFGTINLIVNNSRLSEIKEKSAIAGYVPFKAIQDINDNLRQPQLKTILREPLSKEKIDAMCEELIRYKCGWGAPGEFNRKYFESTCK